MVTYRDAGVDIEAGAKAVDLMKEAVQRTYGPEVLQGLGAFGGLFDVSDFKTMESPTLVASTDGVGTKTKVATAMGYFDTIGFDIVNHCVNDILVQGAKPLFFLDYVAASQLDPEMIAAIVGGCAKACETIGCTLLGGETAEMPGVYADGEFDLVGTVVGVVDRAAIINGSRIEAGDRIIGLASSGLHTNGYSLARRVFADQDWQETHPSLRQSLGEALLTPHRSYLPQVSDLQKAGIDIRGLAHITGGGLFENPPRILPDGIAAVIERESWPVPAIFQMLQVQGQIDEAEMMQAFNMGLGMLCVLPAGQVDDALQILGDDAWLVGETTAQQTGDGVVQVR
ncbi:MAG: phosphoribosylformylglycinamidine cyclo-ligase [Chloroflexota bacterium]